MEWTDNLINIINFHKAGNCPCCGKETVDYRLLENANGYGYGDIWCTNCKRAFHVSRIKITKANMRKQQLPAGLKY